jgi:hypothetical protein
LKREGFEDQLMKFKDNEAILSTFGIDIDKEESMEVEWMEKIKEEEAMRIEKEKNAEEEKVQSAKKIEEFVNLKKKLSEIEGKAPEGWSEEEK